jgi:23S rRNA (cytidine1920-2'-O)/16S rRNA (cytidine1409-2'-O)-methyltransferase
MKKRLDVLLLERFGTLSRVYIQSMIMQGKVKVGGIVVTKPGTMVADDAVCAFDMIEKKYVSRAGYKLEGALDGFVIDVNNLIAMDAGLSTGGFTDCLLQRGVRKVYGVDVGYGQVHEKIRQDHRVVVMERTNLRHLQTLPELVDLATLDLSFISVLKVIDAVRLLIKLRGHLIVLIKPQFEAERNQIGKGGIVIDSAVHDQVIKRVTEGVQNAGFLLQGVIASPIEGTDGNKEFLAYFIRNI